MKPLLPVWINPCHRHVLLSLGLLLLASSTGCSRTFWRNQADKDSYLALTEKLNDPRWALPRIDVTADPRSRFFDPYNPDAEPLPPDDPAAHVYMHWADGWHGYKGWHKFGDLMSVENPQWLANFGWSTDNIDPLTGEVVPPLPELKNVKLREAVELAQIHNRDYQFEIENVYLAALAVTFQRFQFGVRYLGTNGLEPTVNSTSTFVPRGPGGNSAAAVAGGFSQLLPAGTQWAVEFANNTVWLFSGGNQTNSMSSLSYSIVQPLLFGAGRKVGMEGLTQAERNLLYEARVLARLRQQIFTNVVGGPAGYLQLLQELQFIRNQRGNIGRLQEQVERLLAQSARNELFASEELARWPDGDFSAEKLPEPLRGKLSYEANRLRWGSKTPITDEEIRLLRNISNDPVFQESAIALVTTLRTKVATLDVLNLQSSLATNLNTLRTQERQLQDDLDTYKILLGLRTDVKLTIDDGMLKPFEIIDPRLSELEDEIKDFVRIWGMLDEENQDLEQLRMTFALFYSLVERVTENALNVVAADLSSVEQALPERLAQLNEPDGLQLQADISRAKALLAGAANELKLLRNAVMEVAQGLRSDDVSPEVKRAQYQQLNILREQLLRLTQNLTVIQVSLRVELIEVQPFEMAMQTAVAVALDNRVDLMNSRALVMDARRKVEIAANALLSTLNIVVAGDINTPTGNKPFDFSGQASRLRAGFSFTAPLDQIDERNAYRVALINYQRQRRAYMLAEDQVKQDVRNAWRQLYVLRQNLETSRRAVRIAALQYDSAVEQSNAPVSDKQIQAGASAGRSTGSGLAGNNLLNALTAILNAQNSLIQTWISYERNRLNIYRDMGIMEIGEDGLWTDPYYQGQTNEDDQDALRPNLDMGVPAPGADGAGRSRLGRGIVDAGLVEIPDRGNVVPAVAQEPGSGNGQTGTISGEPERAGVPRQPQERLPDEPGRRHDDDYQHRAGRHLGYPGRSRL